MIENAIVSIFSPVMATNNEGTRVKTWLYKLPAGIPLLSFDLGIEVAMAFALASQPIETFKADVQPARLTEVQILEWGISNRASDTKTMLCEPSANVVVNNRAIVVSDFDGLFLAYEIKAVNKWPAHMEAILIPVQGEA